MRWVSQDYVLARASNSLLEYVFLHSLFEESAMMKDDVEVYCNLAPHWFTLSHTAEAPTKEHLFNAIAATKGNAGNSEGSHEQEVGGAAVSTLVANCGVSCVLVG
eukprot:GHVU01163284.1.p2 GENE.GHVU01163284.1~~GHVU01163284.1.p2  ORF type:complete len:105 (+),score=4.20 GHVU01163284.1:156-470(+)